MTATFDRCWSVYHGSDGEATRALYGELTALGPRGEIAVNMFRALKTSERAKVYSRRHKGTAYDTKQWSMDNLARILGEHAGAMDIRWGWGVDDKQAFHLHVLYVDLPTGQVSWHTQSRGVGPDYPGTWDGQLGMGPRRICEWCATLLEIANS